MLENSFFCKKYLLHQGKIFFPDDIEGSPCEELCRWPQVNYCCCSLFVYLQQTKLWSMCQCENQSCSSRVHNQSGSEGLILRAIETQDDMWRCNTAAVMARVSVTAISSHLSRVTCHATLQMCYVVSRNVNTAQVAACVAA